MTRSRYRRMTYRDLAYLRRKIAQAPIDDRVIDASKFAPLASGEPEDEIEVNDQTEKETDE